MKRGMIVFALLLLLLAGCSMLGIGQAGTGTPVSSSEGIAILFVPNLPPPVVYDTEQISIQLQVFNRGAYDVGGPGDRIYLSGFDPNIITGIPPGGKQIPELEGIDEFIIGGSNGFVTFDDIVIRRIPTERFPVRMLATACYEYETTASATICLDPSPHLASLKQKVCNPLEVNMISQAGPVVVSSIVPEPRSGVATFRVFVTDSGAGVPFRAGQTYLNQCSPYDPRGLRFDDFGFAQVIDVTIGGTKAACKGLQGDSHVRLLDGAGQFICEVPVRGSDAYTSPMTVTLRYGYRVESFRNLEVVHTPT